MFIHFVDFHALVNVGSPDHGTNAQVLKFEADAIKAGHTGEEEALVAASFKIEIPVIFGTVANNTAGTKDSRVLPGINIFEDWDSGDGYTGLRYVLAAATEDARSRLIDSAGHNLNGLALLVAIDMITAASNFVKALSTWISQEFMDLVGRGGDRIITWKLICQSVRKFFNRPHVARQADRGQMEPGERPGAMMWGCLQAYKRSYKFVNNEFNSDPDLFYI